MPISHCSALGGDQRERGNLNAYNQHSNNEIVAASARGGAMTFNIFYK